MNSLRLVVAALGTGMAMTALAPVALADPQPNCSAADVAGVAAGVAAGTSTYLFTHPDVNAFFSGLDGKDRDSIKTDVSAYMDANPQVKAEMQSIRQPLTDIRERCGLRGHPLDF